MESPNFLLTLLIGGIGGFALHAISMNVSFKQRTIDNKIKVFDSLIAQWVTMRNFIYGNNLVNQGNALSQDLFMKFDQLYGTAQTLIGEAFLVCEDIDIPTDANELTERLYRTEWNNLSLEDANSKMETIKSDALVLIGKMRDDIKKSTRFDKSDIFYIMSGFWRKK